MLMLKKEALINGFFEKIARDMPSFTMQARPSKVKKIYRALKRDHPGMPAEMKARIAARQGKKGKHEQGPPYKAPIKSTYKSAASVEKAKRFAEQMMKRDKPGGEKVTAGDVAKMLRAKKSRG